MLLVFYLLNFTNYYFKDHIHNNYEGDDFIKKIIVFLLLLINPMIISAYSPYIYAGGESIGIELNSNYVLVVGKYNIKGKKQALEIGDKIISIDGTRISNIRELTKNVQGKTSVKVGFLRDNKYEEETIKIEYEDGIYKTGLYVKDEIVGIGTLTYIDPETSIFGCLGHEISEKVTKKLFEASEGTIFSSYVTKIIKSKNGSPGEKVAKFDAENVYGKINKNTKSGVYGEFEIDINAKKLYKVANRSEIKLGKAKILTTIKGDEIEEFEIKIIKLANNGDNHDILFEIIDSKLLDATNGIVQGMSGSPIIQEDKIVGAVTHVIVDNSIRGYGIFIETMLNEGEN